MYNYKKDGEEYYEYLAEDQKWKLTPAKGLKGKVWKAGNKV